METGAFFYIVYIILSIAIFFSCIKNYNELDEAINKKVAMKCILLVTLIAILGIASYQYYIWSLSKYNIADEGLLVLSIIGMVGLYFPLIYVWTKCPNQKSVNLVAEYKKAQSDKYNTLRILTEQIIVTYDEERIKMPKATKKVQILHDVSEIGIKKGEFYIWKDDETLYFLAVEPIVSKIDTDSRKENYLIKNIPFSRIEYFTTQGEIYRENKISGGGGGGSDLGGAIVGGALAGGAGAVIGSRKKTEEIKSELITHDERQAFINFFKNNGDRASIFFDFNDYQTLLDIAPEKEYAMVYARKMNNLLNKNTQIDETKVIAEKIKEIAVLRDMGILTETEFTDKKNELLAKI
jgi:Ca2+/Na+ antiporter